jgi:glucose-6-phosphate 1-dehydrogenase
MNNPLEESDRQKKTVEPCIMVIFGATGDLTARKLLPAVYNLAREGELPAHFACVGFARRPKTNEQFRQEMLEAVEKFSRVKPVDKEVWKFFSEQLFYHQAEFHEDSGYDALKELLQSLDNKIGTKGNRVFYLSTPASYFPLIIGKLHAHGMIYNAQQVQDKWSRTIIEKPFGEDLPSAQKLQQELSKFLDESQIYRIDHYLGKETVQNILTFRFSNSIFESIWNNRHIHHVQITVAEEIGIGTRGKLWEESGMLRDIVQNHMMQLLCLVAMEPPTNLQAASIHDEKVKVLQALRPLPLEAEKLCAIRGQYGPGYIEGQDAKGYRQEENVDPKSNVETYVALKLLVDNWRWTGVPFYLRAGKRLPKRSSEIAIIFHYAPGYLFHTHTRHPEPNNLVIRIQPNEGISVKMNCKIPGLSNLLQPVRMDFSYQSYFGPTPPPEAYERLLCDCMSGDNTLFARTDEVLASWKLLTPLLQKWQAAPSDPFPNYASGTWGPAEADSLLTQDGCQWRLP